MGEKGNFLAGVALVGLTLGTYLSTLLPNKVYNVKIVSATSVVKYANEGNQPWGSYTAQGKDIISGREITFTNSGLFPLYCLFDNACNRDPDGLQKQILDAQKSGQALQIETVGIEGIFGPTIRSVRPIEQSSKYG